MADNFFKLNEPISTWNTESDFWDAIKDAYNSNILEITDSQYSPQKLKATQGKRTCKNMRFTKCSFAKTDFHGVQFDNCIFLNCLFIGSSFTECYFNHCNFNNCNFHRCNFSHTYIDPRTISPVCDYKKYANVGIWLFKQLAKNAVEMSQHNHRSEAEYKAQVWLRYDLKYNKWKKRSINRAAYYVQLIWSLFLDYSIGFGWKPHRVAMSIILMVLCCLIVNHAMWGYFGATLGGVAANRSIPNSIFVTAGSITSFGTGAISYTTPCGLIWLSAQAIIGVLILAMLASIALRVIVRE